MRNIVNHEIFGFFKFFKIYFLSYLNLVVKQEFLDINTINENVKNVLDNWFKEGYCAKLHW